MSEVFSQVLISKILLMILSFIILLMIIYTIPYMYNMRVVLLATFLYIPGYIMFPEWFFQAMEKMKYITIMNLCSKLIFTVLVFLVIKEKQDYIFQPMLIAVGSTVSGMISLIVVFKTFGVVFITPTFKEIKNMLIKNWNMFLTLFLPNLYTNFSVILLKIYGGTTATGIYSSGNRFIILFDQLSLVLSRTFYPFLARRIDKHDLYVKISAGISILSCIFLFFSADLLIKIFFTEEFQESVKVIRIMAITPFLLFLMNTFGTNYLVLIGKEKVLKNIILICSILGFILSCIIVTHYSYIGISITLVSIWGIRGVVTFYYAKKFQKQSEKNSRE
ncbi:MAG: oligosaccharide flippase family protein [Tannerellaceae bacterium]|nr:oligosaccharide flippase family protein [Tannerellaceae bacterium]